MKKIIPSLKTSGWTTTPTQKLADALRFALTSEYEQSTVYSGKITSLSHIVNTYQTDKIELVEEMRSVLSRYFTDLFDKAEVDVSVDTNADINYNIYISVTVTEENTTLSLSAVAAVDNGLLKNTLEIINQ